MSAKRRSDGDKMKKVLLGAVAAIAVTGAANAQVGTWYNNLAAWTAAVSGVQTENYAGVTSQTNNINSSFGSLVTSTTDLNGFIPATNPATVGIATVDEDAGVQFTFTGNNAFAFFGGVTDENGVAQAGTLTVNVSDGYSQSFSLNSLSFIGYVSNAGSLTSVNVSRSDNFLQFNSFSLGTGTQNPGGGGSSAVPEPGTVVSMGLLGAGVLGLVVRSRRRISN
jgi:hypothetical protein